MARTKINLGLIGLGRLGQLYAEYMAYAVPQVLLVAVSDTDAARARGIADALGVRQYTAPGALIDDQQVDAVAIVTPTRTHFDLVKSAAERKKAIFCEKPLSLSLTEAAEMKRVIERTGVFFQMGFMRRFDKGFSEAKKEIEQGTIGKPLVFRAISRDPYLPSLEYAHPDNSGGLFVDMGVHDYDMARWLMGEIESVHSTAGTLVHPELQAIGDFDNAIVSFTFANGSLGAVDLSRNGVYGYDISADILGTEGTLRVGYLRETPLLVMTKNNVSHDTVPFFPERFGQAYVAQLKNFGENLLGDQPPPVTIEDGIEALRAAIAATDSCRNGQTVRVSSMTADVGGS